MTDFELRALEKIIADRADASPDASYTASLLAKGPIKCAEKFGEEAVELVLAGAAQATENVENEAADVLYHLLVLLNAREVSLEQVMTILEKRTAQSGHAEKASRE